MVSISFTTCKSIRIFVGGRFKKNKRGHKKTFPPWMVFISILCLTFMASRKVVGRPVTQNSGSMSTRWIISHFQCTETKQHVPHLTKWQIFLVASTFVKTQGNPRNWHCYFQSDYLVRYLHPYASKSVMLSNPKDCEYQEGCV